MLPHIIYKYALKNPTTELLLPKDAKILDVQVQDGTPHLWARVDTTAPLEERTFYVVNTGERMPEDEELVYVATFQQDNGAYVGHVFEYRRAQTPVTAGNRYG